MEDAGEDNLELIPRNYQVALFEKCMRENTIIFLPTGAGKTFIAIMALKRMGKELLGENHKISIILVNTVALVDQHTKYIKQHTPFEVAGFSGEMNVDFWNSQVWNKQLQKNQVLVMTCEILAGIVRNKIFDLNRANLLIFDECHHGVNDHSMRQIMTNFQNLAMKPRVIGLTATLLNGNCKPDRVMNEVETLEITFQSKVATLEESGDVDGYATNPKEILETFCIHTLSGVEFECIQHLDTMMKNLSYFRIETEVNERIKHTSLTPLEPNDGLKKVINIVKDLKFHLENLGIYGGSLCCISYNIQIERMKKHSDNFKLCRIMDYMQTILGYIKVKFERAMQVCTSEKERFWKFSSPKVLTLVSILKKFKETSKEELCGLIFVQRRFTAKIIYHILDALSKCDPDYSFIRSNFIIGNNNNPLCDTRESLYYSKKNRQVLDEFVKKETNLLCTSQVLEEGVDIPKCTLVCKFDLPNDYRSYIQSKGRARHKESQYYIMIPEDQRNKFKSSYTQFQLIEHTLNDFLIGRNDVRDGPSKENIEDMYNEQIVPPYYVSGPESAYVNLISAISLLCRYCQNLPRDQYTSCNPEWYLEKVEYPEGIFYMVTILLPTICPIIDPIQGIPMKRKKTAKRVAALKACILLHQIGELTDSLIPAERNIQEEDISFLFEHYPKVKEEGAGTRKIRIHNIQIPDVTLGPLLPSHESYLHIVNLTPLFARDKLDIGKQTVYDMYVSNMCFGILTPNRFPPIFSFPIYVTDGTIMVSIANNVKMVKLTNVELKKIREFHFIVFNDILELLNSFLITDCSDRAESMILVPVLKDESRIDFDVIEKYRSVRSIDCTLNHSEKLGLVVNDDTYKHKIVIPPYRKDMPIYLVTEVCYGMTPQSNFPNEDFENFVEYYRKVHQESIVNRDQPLLYVKRLSQKINLFKPSGFEKGKKRQKANEEYQEYLIPEMLVKQEFPAVLWIQARFLPSILSRVSYVLRVEKLWQRIGIECGFLLNTTSMKLLELNKNLIKYEAIINEKELNAQTRKYYEKSEGMLALPSSLKSSCNKDFQSKLLESRYPWKDLEEPKDINRTLDVTVMDIEAYENFINHKVVGEERQAVHKSPLKIKYPALTYDTPFKERSIGILSGNLNGKVELADIYEALTTAKANDIVNLERLETLGDSFLKYIASFYIIMRFPQYDEGRATQLKGRLISNKNLFYLAQKLQIGGIMKNSDLIATKEWLPPGFCVPEQLQDGIKDEKVSVYSLFKCDFSREEIISGAVNESFLCSIMVDNLLNEFDDTVYQNRQFLKQQCLKDKCVADVVEAILGTYLLNTGIAGCLKVIEWIGIIPKSENIADYFKRQVMDPVIKPNATMDDIIFHLPLYHEIEKIIDYEFKNKGFLVQAFTHASYSPNRATRSYEKLEFLGDAVLDFLITCFIYESCGYLSPGELTDLRSALVNNNTFASFVVRLGLQKFLLMMNSTLQSHVDRFVDFMTEKNFEIDDEVLILLEEEDLQLAEYIDVPKVLGDIFEALAGAIFLDSGYDLEVVWKVFYKIMWREIELFSSNVPKNMVRKLYECEGAFPSFGNVQNVDKNRMMIKLHFHAEGRPKFVYGCGSNKVLAKKAAAKIALRYMNRSS